MPSSGQYEAAPEHCMTSDSPMDFEWVAIALGDVAWISVAFALGLFSRLLGLPPLVGFLATGFLLNAQGIASGQVLQKLADLGITLLLFTVGLKLNLQTLVRPQVWAVASIHMLVVVLAFGPIVYLFALSEVPLLLGLDLPRSFLVAFALSFSSTVFAVKVLEDKGEMKALHGRIAIGILIVQDLAAVVFLACAEGKIPSPWVLLLVLLLPLRPLLHRILGQVGHGELLVLYGLLLALGGAKIFELFGLKGDLGALVIGVMVASHPRSQELAKTMLGFKDLFLLGFFLSIGLSGQPTASAFAAALACVPLIFIKSVLFFLLLSRFSLRARTSLMATLSLSNYSEFGLIVVAVGISQGWIGNEWLIVLAAALSISFALSAIVNSGAHQLYGRYRKFWLRLQRPQRLSDDSVVSFGEATIAIIGMGRVGTAAYDKMRGLYGETVVGVDSDPVKVCQHQENGRQVLLGDPSDADFWERAAETHRLDLVMLALPKLEVDLMVIDQLQSAQFAGRVAATARFPDEIETLERAGVETVFNVYTEAGIGFAEHVASQGAATARPP